MRPFSGAKTSEAFGVEAEIVKEPGELTGAIARAHRAIADGARPALSGQPSPRRPERNRTGFSPPDFDVDFAP